MQPYFLKKHLSVIGLIVTITLFLVYKVIGLSFRFGDTTAYWYMASQLVNGVLPYRDFFLADPPVYVLMLVPLVQIFKNNLIVLQLLPAIFECGTAVLLFIYSRREKVKYYWLVPIVYLFSFTILATSDYGTGLQLATFALMMGLVSLQQHKYWYVGCFFAVSCLVKLYAAPIVLGVLFFYFFKKNYTQLAQIIFSGLFTTVLIVCPFIYSSGQSFFEAVIMHHFFRPMGINKLSVLSFFLQNDGVLLLWVGIAVYNFKRHLLLLLLIFQFSFFLLFKDLYYAYLGILMPFIAILSVQVFEVFNTASLVQQRLKQMVSMVFVFWLLFTNIYYWKVIQPEGVFATAQNNASELIKQRDNYPLYGSHEIAPLLALLSNRKIFENTIDTNTQTFASGVHDKATISQRAVSTGIYLAVRTTQDPFAGKMMYLYNGYFSQTVFEKSCKLLLEDTEQAQTDNGVAIFFCKS